MSRVKPGLSDPIPIQGQVVAAHGRHFLVLNSASNPVHCVPRGKKMDVVCGDLVEIRQSGPEQYVIESVLPRNSLFKRSDAFRTKSIAANATQIAIVLAPRPSWSEDLLQRCLMAAENQNLNTLIIANKSDLPEHAETKKVLRLYASLGYKVLSITATQDGAAYILPMLKGQTTLLVGQSGMGKSTLINHLLPEVQARVNPFSEALDTGKHTTTDTRMYRLDQDSAIIDSPGFQEFALAHLDKDELERCMPEFKAYAGQCRFRNCSHLHEPGCAIQQAVKDSQIAASRLAFFHRIRAENDRGAQY